jgi:hypothetical protein
MNISIRHYTPQDFKMLESWWKYTNQAGLTESMLPNETTFVMEIDSVPASCVCLYLTNCYELAYLGNFVSNPELKGPKRHEANKELMKFIKDFANESGYKHVLAFAKEEKLKTHFETLGMRKTLKNLDSFVVGE